MATFIGSFEHEGTRYFFDYSTVSDAPDSGLMTREEYEGQYRERFGSEGMEKLPARLERAIRDGSSAVTPESLEDLVFLNRAGPNEDRLTCEELKQALLRERKDRTP